MVSVVNLLAEIVWKELAVLQKMAFVQMVATNQVSTILASTIKSANITASMIVRSTKPTKAAHLSDRKTDVN